MPTLQSSPDDSSSSDGDSSDDSLGEDIFNNSTQETTLKLILNMEEVTVEEVYTNFDDTDDQVPDGYSSLQDFEAHIEAIASMELDYDYFPPTPSP